MTKSEADIIKINATEEKRKEKQVKISYVALEIIEKEHRWDKERKQINKAKEEKKDEIVRTIKIKIKERKSDDIGDILNQKQENEKQ